VLKCRWGLSTFSAVADCCMCKNTPPQISRPRYSSIIQYFTLIFWQHVDWYNIQWWPKRGMLKRIWGMSSFITVADCYMCTYSHPKISLQHSSSIFQYFTLIFLQHVDWYNIQRWPKRGMLKRIWGLSPFITVADCYMCRYSLPKISLQQYSSIFQYFTLIFW